MKSGKNKQLDFLLVNLYQYEQQPDFSQALHYRQKNSVQSAAWTWFGTQQYNKYGPGVSLYFTSLKYLVHIFLFLALASIPMLIVNSNGNGLTLYGDSFSNSLMRLSFSNQPSLQFQKYDLTQIEQQHKIFNIKIYRIVIIINDLICTCIFIAFLIFWEIKSQQLVCQINKIQTLPSYHTLIAKLPPQKISQQTIRSHFQKFGSLRQVQFIYDYGNFLFQIKQFTSLVQKYNQQKDQIVKNNYYIQIQAQYQRIKLCYKTYAQKNQISSHQQPFTPIFAFITFQDCQLRKKVFGLYRYNLKQMGLDIQGHLLKLKKCDVEPLSIIWQNYHLPPFSEIKRSLIFGLTVAFLLLLTLFCIFILSLYTISTQIQEGQYDYETVVKSKNINMIYSFCSNLTYKTFNWKYYEICKQYFLSFQHRWALILTLSCVIVCINLILIKIVFILAQVRRFRTQLQKKRFLIISIFLTYFIGSSILVILTRGQIKINNYSISLVKFAKFLFPSLPSVQSYESATRKWYLSIGKILLANYFLTLIICPWLYIIQQWILQKIRQLWSIKSKNLRQMKERIQNRQFYWQFYYALIMNSVYFCSIFSIAMPILYLLALGSILSIFLTSKYIFHRFTKIPQMFDHTLNKFIFKSLGMAFVLHQYTSYLFLKEQQIFQSSSIHYFQNSSKKIYFFIIFIITFIFVIFSKKISQFIKNRLKPKQDLMITQQVNSSFGASGVFNMQKLTTARNKFRVSSFTMKQGSYLSSYKMQDNPYYNNISYTLLILYQVIVQRKGCELEPNKRLNQQQRFVHSMQKITTKNEDLQLSTNRNLNQSI